MRGTALGRSRDLLIPRGFVASCESLPQFSLVGTTAFPICPSVKTHPASILKKVGRRGTAIPTRFWVGIADFPEGDSLNCHINGKQPYYWE